MSPTQLTPTTDLFGRVLVDYLRGDRVPVHLRRSDGRLALLDVESYFVPGEGLTPVERELLSTARGAVLDVGAGAGRFAVHLQAAARPNGPVTEVVALDSSAGACECLRRLGMEVVVHSSWERVAQSGIWKERFDTILLGGTGFGVAGRPESLPGLLSWLEGRLRSRGIVLGTAETPQGRVHAQTLRLRVEYRGMVGEWFDWLQVAPPGLADAALRAGLRPEEFYFPHGPEVEARPVPGLHLPDLELRSQVCEYGVVLTKPPGPEPDAQGSCGEGVGDVS